MKKITVTALGFLLANLSIAANPSEPQIIRNCWDRTFSYKVATLVKNGDNFEIGVAGTWLLNNSSVVDRSGMPLSVTAETRIFLNFAASECEQKVDGTLTCMARASSPAKILSNKVFIEHQIWNLDEQIYPIAEVWATDVSVDMKKDAITLTINDNRYADAPASTTVAFRLKYCALNGQSGGTHFGTNEFPAALRSYLAGSSTTP